MADPDIAAVAMKDGMQVEFSRVTARSQTLFDLPSEILHIIGLMLYSKSWGELSHFRSV